MPSGVAMVPDTLWPSDEGARVREQGKRPIDEIRTLTPIKATSSRATSSTERVDERHVELRLGRQLDPGGRQPALDRPRRLGAAADEPAHQLVPARRRQEDQQRLGHRLADLPGALQVDLEQHGSPAARRSSTGAARGAVAVAGELGPLEQLAVRDQLVELVVGRRSGSARRRPRPGAARVVADTESQTSGWTLAQIGRRRCSCRPPRGRRARSAADVDRRAAMQRLSRFPDVPGTSGGCRRTRAPARRSGWCRDRGPGGSRRCRAAP